MTDSLDNKKLILASTRCKFVLKSIINKRINEICTDDPGAY